MGQANASPRLAQRPPVANFVSSVSELIFDFTLGRFRNSSKSFNLTALSGMVLSTLAKVTSSEKSHPNKLNVGRGTF